MKTFNKVLVANRGEIAVRVIRGAHDAGLSAVAVFSESDRGALHTRIADDAYGLGGTTAAESYLDAQKILRAAAEMGADAVHPGYGFLSENSGFARAVIQAGLVWIGPPPEAIDVLGDKVTARQLAQRVGAPMVAGTKEPVESVSEVFDFADEYGLPLAVKAAHGGGGRGIRVVRSRDDIEELYESAVREAVSSFGRGECFVETFLDAPRHVETQCLADAEGHVVVVSTRDCSLQRRNQKLIEEAPAPFLSDAQNRELYEASKAILSEAGYIGAGTCEFLVGRDGIISFLEVNTRLQVEHPVSEEVTGLDLVQEQFRLARGEPLDCSDPDVRGHSFEFRINCEDPGRDFLPDAGRLDVLDLPTGPGVRVDAGVKAGDVVAGNFDSMIAKVIVTGADRRSALRRAARALDEMNVQGVATVLPFHRQMLKEANFAPELQDSGPESAEQGFSLHTRWIESDFTSDIESSSSASSPVMGEGAAAFEQVVAEMSGRAVRTDLPLGVTADLMAVPRIERKPVQVGESAADVSAAVAPMRGVVSAVLTNEGARVAAGDRVAVLEAMKMEWPVFAPIAGTITELTVVQGEDVLAGSVLLRIDPEQST